MPPADHFEEAQQQVHIVHWLIFLGTYDRSECLLSARVEQAQTERQTDTRHGGLSGQQIYIQYSTWDGAAAVAEQETEIMCTMIVGFTNEINLLKIDDR